MSRDNQLEELVLAREYKWLLGSESHRTYRELTSVLSVAIELLEQKSKSKGEKFILNGPNGSRCVLCIEGFHISEADVNIKLIRHGNQLTIHHTKITRDMPCKLSQLQEATNYLNEALQLAETALELPNHESAHQLINELEDLIGFLRRSKDALVVPTKSALFNNNATSTDVKFNPPLPADLYLNFSIQSPKIVCLVQQMVPNQKMKPVFTSKFSMETIVPRLNDVMLVICRSFNLCQMLKDKFAYFLKLDPEILSLKRFEKNAKEGQKKKKEEEDYYDDIFEEGCTQPAWNVDAGANKIRL